MEHIKIKDWSVGDRPREKLSLSGPGSLSVAELIAILLRTGTAKSTALDLSRQVLAYADNNLIELARLSVSDLSKIKGLGPVKATTLVAALELGRRRNESEGKIKTPISCSQDAVKMVQHKLSDLHHEEFCVILMNKANRVIDIKTISQGGLSGTVVDPKVIFREALQVRACAMILCHNHPSGNPKPSEADLQLTRKIKEAGKNLEISVLDHVIIAGSTFYSFADEGII
jgi:DNA repair protein RadC